ncbi:MAG: hypothetical protein PHX25_00460 [Candidatus Pacebacteria bacterium]|nr:hypothetical protein [Candidatus Paceibacterota bacterium]
MSMGNIFFLFVSIQDKNLLPKVMEEVNDWGGIKIVDTHRLADTIITDNIKNDWFVTHGVRQVVLVNIPENDYKKVLNKWSCWTNICSLNFV